MISPHTLDESAEDLTADRDREPGSRYGFLGIDPEDMEWGPLGVPLDPEMAAERRSQIC